MARSAAHGARTGHAALAGGHCGNRVREVEQYLETSLPPDYAERLAAKAQHLYPRHRQFHKALNRPGNRGRDNLYVYMRHWTCSWLKRERYALYKKLPWSFALGVALYPKRPRTGRALAGR